MLFEFAGWAGCLKPTCPGCPLCPPRFIWPPPPRFMLPRCPGPPLFMRPPRGPILPLMGPPRGDPPRMGMWPRLKFPRPGKPPLTFRGGRKLRGGREKPQCGPGPARTSEHQSVRFFLDISTDGVEARHQHTSSVVASVLEASSGTASVSGSSSPSKLVLASAASSTLAAASLGHRASLVGFLLSWQSGLAFLPVLLQQLGGLLLLQLCEDDLTEAVALLRKSVEPWNKNRCRTVKNMPTCAASASWNASHLSF